MTGEVWRVTIPRHQRHRVCRLLLGACHAPAQDKKGAGQSAHRQKWNAGFEDPGSGDIVEIGKTINNKSEAIKRTTKQDKSISSVQLIVKGFSSKLDQPAIELQEGSEELYSQIIHLNADVKSGIRWMRKSATLPDGAEVSSGHQRYALYCFNCTKERLMVTVGNILVAVDDSGDAGFKFEHGSSRHFVLACVVFKDAKIAEQVAAVMAALRDSKGWSAKAEFKFNKTRKAVVKELIAAVVEFDFEVRAICVEKSLIRSGHLRLNNETFYTHVLLQFLDRIPDLDGAKIKVDGQADQKYGKATEAYFRKRLNNQGRRIRQFKFQDSAQDLLVQLADIAAGSIRRSKDAEKTDSQEYIELLRSRIVEIWDYL
jgi:hypothetical protein